MIKLFIGGFPLETNELELVKLVSPYGEVSTIKIVRDKKTNICKGYAFLELTEQHGAEQAIEALDGTTLGGRELTLNIVEEKAEPAPSAYVKIRRPDNNNYTKPKRPRRIN